MQACIFTIIMILSTPCYATPPTLDMNYRTSSGSLYQHINDLIQATKQAIKALTQSLVCTWILEEEKTTTHMTTKLPIVSTREEKIMSTKSNKIAPDQIQAVTT